MSGPRVLGTTLFKKRLLQAQGWRIVNVPYFEWETLTDARGQEEYLQTKLASVSTGSTGSTGAAQASVLETAAESPGRQRRHRATRSKKGWV